MRYEYRVTCDAHYYGAGCANLCRPRDDNFGHYKCSPTGDRVCLSGWQGDYCTKRKCFSYMCHLVYCMVLWHVGVRCLVPATSFMIHIHWGILRVSRCAEMLKLAAVSDWLRVSWMSGQHFLTISAHDMQKTQKISNVLWCIDPLLGNESVNTPKIILDKRRRRFPWGPPRGYITGSSKGAVKKRKVVPVLN
jgi:hypothetical protein